MFFLRGKKENTCTWPFSHGLSMLLLYTHLLTLRVLLDLTSRTLINIMLIQVNYTSPKLLGYLNDSFQHSVYIFYYSPCFFLRGLKSKKKKEKADYSAQSSK